MPACELKPADRKRQIKRVGEDLVRHYGKKRYYTVEQVRQANHRQLIGFDFGCWSFAFFSSHEDFDRYHQSVGESCDYLSMKREMAESVSSSGGTNWLDFDFDLSWLEIPDIDLSIFDFFDW